MFITFESVLIRLFVQVMVPWMSNRPEAYAAWCRVWASEGFKQKSINRRANRGSKPNHTFGGDCFTRKAKRMVRKLTNMFRCDMFIYSTNSVI